MATDKTSKLRRFRERIRIAFQGGHKIDFPFLLEEAQYLKSSDERVEWLEQILFWIRLSGGSKTTPQTSLRFLLSRIEQNPQWKEHFVRTLQQVLLQSSYVHLFTDTGVHSNYDFFRESTSRIVKRIFPAYGNSEDMESVINRVFEHEEDANWISSLNIETRKQLESWIFSDNNFRDQLKEHLISDALESSSFLSIRASALAIQRELMERANCRKAAQIPLLRLRWHLEDFFAELIAAKGKEEVNESFTKVLEEIEKSRKYLEGVLDHLEEFGVSVRIVFSVESVESILNRVETLVQLSLWLRFPNQKIQPWELFEKFLRDSWTEKRVSPLLRSNFRLLSRKIVEKSGATGEDYITSTKGEYLSMFYAALGGGFITAFTGLIKFWGPTSGAPFLLGLYAALNYSMCFILMHHLHFKLATKQPAMTAAALAKRLGSSHQEKKMGEFVDLVARISRSQFAAIAGNILAVIPTAIAIDYLSRWATGSNIVEPAYASKTLNTFHPFTTLTIFYAALTGGLLWTSGLISGWIENAYVYFQVPRALNNYRFFRLLFEEKWLENMVSKFTKNLSGWSSSIGLAILLAFIPVIGKFFGLPLDVRHVTLTTGSAAYAFSSIGWQDIQNNTLLFTSIGILFIGIMNFGVSFSLALYIAVKANDIPGHRMRLILTECLTFFKSKPGKFFFP